MKGRGGAAGTDRTTDGPLNVPAQVDPLTETTNEALTGEKGDDGTISTKAPRAPRQRQRGPPEDGVPSKTKVMVANLPYDLNEDKVSVLAMIRLCSC